MKKIKILAISALMIAMLVACGEKEVEEPSTIIDAPGQPSTEQIEGYNTGSVIDGDNYWFKTKEDGELFKEYYFEEKDKSEYEESRIYKDSPEVGLWWEDQTQGKYAEEPEDIDKYYIYHYKDDGSTDRYYKYNDDSETKWYFDDTDAYRNWRSEEDDITYNIKEVEEDGKYIKTTYSSEDIDKEKTRTEITEDERKKSELYIDDALFSVEYEILEDEIPEEILVEMGKRAK